MRLNDAQSLILIAVIAVCTFLTRALPFLLFPGSRPTPAFIRYLGEVLPFAMIAMLVVYCLKEVQLTQYPYGIPECIAVLFVALVHKWRHNLLLSIGGGTVLYMVLVQCIFTA